VSPCVPIHDSTAIFCPFRSDGFIKTQRESQDIRGRSTIYIGRRRGAPGRHITDQHDDGYRVLACRLRHSEVRGSDSSNTYPVSLPTGFVGGRSSLLTAVLAAGPPPWAGRTFLTQAGFNRHDKKTNCRRIKLPIHTRTRGIHLTHRAEHMGELRRAGLVPRRRLIWRW
jgi:hypothetical protein